MNNHKIGLFGFAVFTGVMAIAWSQSVPAGFNITLAPPQRIIVQGGWQEVAVQVARTGGFSGPVTLELRGAPSGISGVFAQDPVVGRSTKLTVNIAATVPVGAYTLTVHGAAGTAVDIPLQVTVVAPMPVPTVSIDSRMESLIGSLPSGDPAHPRTVGCLADAKHQTHFVKDELIVATNDPARLAAFVSRWKGTVTSTLGGGTALPLPQTIYLVRVDASQANVAALPQNMQKANPNVTGALRFCDSAGMRLFAAAAEEAATGLTTGLNFVAQPYATFLTGVSNEAPVGDKELNGVAYNSNVFQWSYMGLNSLPGTGVTHAWQALEYGGKLANTTTVAIIEQGGFGPNGDFPVSTGISLIPNQNPTFVPNPLLTGEKKPSRWHGTLVAQSLAGIANNGFGAAGTGGAGPNVNLMLISASMDTMSVANAVATAAFNGARIINMSFGGAVPALATLGSVGTANSVTDAVRKGGVLIFAAAGNFGENVDEEDCFIACWEGAWWFPCENDGVTCVGGLDHDSRDRHPASNFGSGKNGDVATVDIWAPFDVLVGPDPDNPANVARRVGGTSFSSPFVSGVAAMVLAANPALSADQVEGVLFDTAGVSFDLTVNNDRVILADLAVMSVLGDMPPQVTITAPANNTTVGYGGLNQVTFTASAVDFEDGAKCCKLTWTSDVDGAMGSGAKVVFVFATAGKRTITVRAEDFKGNHTDAKIAITAGNTPPTVKINKPSAGATIYKNVATVFDGQGADPNEVGFVLPCANLTWSTNVAGDPKLTGCNPVFQFATLGQRTIQLIGKDSQGASSPTAKVTVNVIDIPPGSGAIVTILKPVDHSVFAIGEHSLLAFSITGGNSFNSYQWRVVVGGKEVPIVVYQAGTPSAYWVPSNYLTGSCGESTSTLRLYVNGVLGDQVTVGVNYGPC